MSDDPVLALLVRVDERVGRVDERVARIDESVARIDERVAGIDERFAQIDERFARIEERLDRLEVGQAALERSQTSLRVDLMARMDRLGDQLTLTKDDIGVTMASVDSVRKANDATKEELRSLSDIVYTTVRQLRQLRERFDEFLDKPPAP